MPDQNKNKSREQEMDDFWDIDKLLPEQPSRRPPLTRPASRRPSPAAVDVSVEPVRKPGEQNPQAVTAAPLTVRPDAERPTPTQQKAVPQSQMTGMSQPRPANDPAGKTPVPEGTGTLPLSGLGTPHYVPPHTAREDAEEQPPECEYTPVSALLHRVQVFPWRSNYHYFDQFTRDAIKYASARPPEGEVSRESFFSFFPQYVQMNRRQMSWYLSWRQRVRQGQFPETDYAYVLLYIFELINLPVEGEACAGRRDLMADVWMAYRRMYPQLDHYMCEWLCDFCLIHQLHAPADKLAPALDAIIRIAALKEFYLSPAVCVQSRGSETARILLRHCCQYDYHKSKFATGEAAELFDRTIPDAVAAVLPLLLGHGENAPLIQMQDSVMNRDAYSGALCSFDNKRRIKVSYTSFSRSHELRFLIGDMVKHVENRLRGWIGVRSRLSVMSLPVPVRQALDQYLEPLAPARPAPTPKKQPPRPAYEAMYDLPRKEVSLSDADAIERDSWTTTRILTEAFGQGGEDTAAPAGTAPADKTQEDTVSPVETTPEDTALQDAANTTPSDLAGALGPLCEFVRLALAADGQGQRAMADRMHTMPDALADKVNAITAEHEIYDVILDDRGDGTYVVLDDYRYVVRKYVGE